MITFPNAKINLGLNITERRPDGYHNIETVFYPIPIHDALEIVESDNISLTISGLKIDGNTEQNLIMKAYRLLASSFELPKVEINLLKKIPFGAGLGGGSSDAAFTIKMLNEKFKLNLTEETQKTFAAKLGADCAFFIANRPSYATGIGDKLNNINISLSNYYIYLIKPDIHISTSEAYSSVVPHKNNISLYDRILKTPITNWKNVIFNDFEESVFTKHREIKEVKELLYKQGALYASMSGSGSSVFGIFDKRPQPLSVPENWFSFIGVFD